MSKRGRPTGEARRSTVAPSPSARSAKASWGVVGGFRRAASSRLTSSSVLRTTDWDTRSRTALGTLPQLRSVSLVKRKDTPDLGRFYAAVPANAAGGGLAADMARLLRARQSFVARTARGADHG